MITQRLGTSTTLVALLLSSCWLSATAAGLDTEQRLALLERRAAKITDLTLQVDALKRENSQLQGQIEQITYQLAQQARKQRDMYQDLTQQIETRVNKQTTESSPENNSVQPTSAEKTTPLIQVAAPTTVAKPKVPESVTLNKASVKIVKQITPAKQAYDAALAHIMDAKQEDYPKAITAFQAFINDYPQHTLVANAHYWTGSAYRALQDYVAASTAFQQVVQQHPNSSKAPDALYMIGRTQQSQGQDSAARRTWQQVITQFPKTDAATYAQQKLLATDTPDDKP